MNLQTKTPTKPRPNIGVLIAMASIGTLALNIFIPSMPSLVKSLATTQNMAQLTLTFYLISLAFAQLIIGPLSDKIGRRPTLLWGVSLYIVASLAAGFAQNIETLIIARIFQAFGGCSGVVVTRAIIRDVYSKHQSVKILSYITAVVTLAPMLAPILGAYLDQWASWRTSLYFVGGFGMVIGLIALKNLHETNFNLVKNLNLKSMPRQYWSLLREPEYMGYALATTFNASVFFSFIAGAPFIIANILHLPPSVYAFYFILNTSGYMVGNFFAGKFAAHHSTQKVIGFGSILMIIGILTAIYCYYLGYSHPIILFGPMVIVATSAGLIAANAMAGLLAVRPDIAGTAAGLSGFLQMSSAALATFLVGFFSDENGTSMIIFMTIFAALSIISFYSLIDKHQTKDAKHNYHSRHH